MRRRWFGSHWGALSAPDGKPRRHTGGCELRQVRHADRDRRSGMVRRRRIRRRRGRGSALDVGSDFTSTAGEHSPTQEDSVTASTSCPRAGRPRRPPKAKHFTVLIEPIGFRSVAKGPTDPQPSEEPYNSIFETHAGAGRRRVGLGCAALGDRSHSGVVRVVVVPDGITSEVGAGGVSG